MLLFSFLFLLSRAHSHHFLFFFNPLLPRSSCLLHSSAWFPRACLFPVTSLDGSVLGLATFSLRSCHFLDWSASEKKMRGPSCHSHFLLLLIAGISLGLAFWLLIVHCLSRPLGSSQVPLFSHAYSFPKFMASVSWLPISVTIKGPKLTNSTSSPLFPPVLAISAAFLHWHWPL